MSSRISSITAFTAHVREYLGDRRRAPRYKTRCEAHLLLTVSVPDKETGARATSRMLALNGHTLNISKTGIALSIPVVFMDEYYLKGEGRTLRIALGLPTGSAAIHTVPVRVENLIDENEANYLIAAKFEKMSDIDHARFVEYLSLLQ